MDVIKILYTTLVRSTLEFACSIWHPYQYSYKSMVESVQKQMVIFMKGDHVNCSDNNYVLAPYKDRCDSVELNTLVRRRLNLTILFIHSVISGKLKSPALRSQMTLNTGIRTLRNPEFIRVKVARTERSTFSPFKIACHLFNLAVLFIDPTLPHNEFRRRLLKLPDINFLELAKHDN